jgi:alanine dehydrogenase
MLLLTHEEVSGLLSPPEAIEAVRAGLAEQAAGQVQLPPRTTVDATSGPTWLRLMPVIMNRSGYMGFKAMHSTPKVGVRYYVALYHMESGQLLAQVDADWLTIQRTAATVAVATDALSNPNVAELGMLGSSEQARAMVRAVAAVRSFQRARVYSPNPEHRADFARSVQSELGIETAAVDSAEEAAQAGVVCVAIRAGQEPVFKAEWLGSGSHLNGISSVRPESREIEDAVWARAAVVVVDDCGHVLESGDGRSGLASGQLREDRMAELWQMVGGQRRARESADQVTLFKSVGTALQDLSLAVAVYRKALERGIGRDVGDFPHVRPFGRR